MAGRYEKGLVLGTGTFGSVYKAVDKQVGLSAFAMACLLGWGLALKWHPPAVISQHPPHTVAITLLG